MKPHPTITTFLNIVRAVEIRLMGPGRPVEVRRASGAFETNQEHVRSVVAAELDSLRKAHVIDFSESGADLFALVYKTVFDTVQADPDAAPTSVDFDKVVEWGLQVPTPTDLPFPDVYFGFGHGIPLREGEILARMGVERAARVHRVSSLGYLIRSTGYIVEYLSVYGLDPNDRNASGVMLLYPKLPDKPWASPLSLTPFFLHALVHAVNDSRGFVVPVLQTFGSRRTFKQAADGLGLRMPPPKFYTVHLRQHLTRRYVRDAIGEPPEKPNWSHRWDVRKHERVRVQRGPLPMAPRLKEGLVRRGYVVYDTKLPSPVDAIRMHERDHAPKTPDEWVALLVTKVADHIKGPEDLPYVPSSRMVVGDRQVQVPSGSNSHFDT